jgi:hypothetical protein
MASLHEDFKNWGSDLAIKLFQNDKVDECGYPKRSISISVWVRGDTTESQIIKPDY